MKRIPNAVFSLVALIVVIIAWIALSQSKLLRPGFLPSPAALLAAFADVFQHGYQGHTLWQHVFASLARTLTGFLIGVLIGTPIGLLAGYSRIAGAMLSPIMAFIRPIPPIAFIPMAVLYFGLGELGKIVLIVFVSFNYVQANAQAGAANFPIAYRRAAESIGLTRAQTFF